MKSVKTTLLLSLSLLIFGCSKSTTSNNTSKSNTTSAAASPTATAEKSPVNQATQMKAATPEDAAKGLLDAWKTKDESAAAKFATDAAFKKLFTEGGGPVGLESQGCTEEGGTFECAYTYPGGALILFVKGSASAGYKVDSIEFIAD